MADYVEKGWTGDTRLPPLGAPGQLKEAGHGNGNDVTSREAGIPRGDFRVCAQVNIGTTE